jgi:hypothetical protein
MHVGALAIREAMANSMLWRSLETKGNKYPRGLKVL